MIHAWHIVTVASLAGMLAVSGTAQSSNESPQPAHARTQFQFTVNAPLELTAPLFGADKERVWAPGWNPRFVYPDPAKDQQGMVFQVAHGPRTATWVNTAFDLAGGHIQYAYVLAEAMVTTIDIRLARAAADKTTVTVVYERTALIADANEHVQHFAAGDGKSGDQWAAQINGYLAKQRPKN